MIKKLLPLLARIGSGIVDSVPVLATIKTNVASMPSGVGKVDYVRLSANITTAIIAIAALCLFASGKLSFDELEKLTK